MMAKKLNIKRFHAKPQRLCRQRTLRVCCRHGKHYKQKPGLPLLGAAPASRAVRHAHIIARNADLSNPGGLHLQRIPASRTTLPAANIPPTTTSLGATHLPRHTGGSHQIAVVSWSHAPEKMPSGSRHARGATHRRHPLVFPVRWVYTTHEPHSPICAHL
jgi:hypothetical protein